MSSPQVANDAATEASPPKAVAMRFEVTMVPVDPDGNGWLPGRE